MAFRGIPVNSARMYDAALSVKMSKHSCDSITIRASHKLNITRIVQNHSNQPLSAAYNNAEQRI